MSGEYIDGAPVLFVLGMYTLITILIVVVWQWFATRRARASVAREEAYRKLAEQSIAA